MEISEFIDEFLVAQAPLCRNTGGRLDRSDTKVGLGPHDHFACRRVGNPLNPLYHVTHDHPKNLS
jgi:hypothetical protein